MMRFMNLVKFFVENFHPYTESKKMIAKWKHFRTIGKLEEIIAEEKRSNIVSSINNYLSSNGQPTVEQEADLCGKILKLTHTSFIQRVAEFYTETQSIVEEMWQVVRRNVGYCQLVVAKYNGNQGAMWADLRKDRASDVLSNYMPRLLQAINQEYPLADLFKGDVSVFLPGQGPIFSVVDMAPNPWFK